MKDFDLRYPGAAAMLKSYASIAGQIQSTTLQQAVQIMEAVTNAPAVMSVQKQYAELQRLQPYIESAMSIQRQIEVIYGPLQDVTKIMTAMTMEWSAALQASKALLGISQIEFSELSRISKTVQGYFSDINPSFVDLSEEELRDYCEEGKITPDTVAETVGVICTEASGKEKLTIPDRIDKVKRTNWFFALTIIIMILSFLGQPVIDHLKDDTLKSWGVTDFWEESGIYEWIDQLFDIPAKTGAVSESAAKAAVKEPVGNVSKAKRDDLLSKIKAIHDYIAAAPQDKNTGSLLTYLSDLENDVNGKKYGLVFEEHREAIDEVLDTHTPVLTEEPELLIDHGGEMNFLLEGDNLAALRLLEKTHRGVDDFKYDDNYITKSDSYIHSKWISSMVKRLEIAKKLLRPDGVIFISIDNNEQANLKLLCDTVFGEQNYAGMIPWRKRTAKTDVPFGISQDYEWILIYTASEQFNAFTSREKTS